MGGGAFAELWMEAVDRTAHFAAPAAAGIVSASPMPGIAEGKGVQLSSLLCAKWGSTQLEPPEKHTAVIPDLSESGVT